MTLAKETFATINVVYVKTADLVPYVANSRTHSEEQVAQIAASIKEFGFTNPILTDGDNGIIAGHGRLMAARKLGLAEVPTIALTGLTDAQKRAYVIADNKLALNAGWDAALLSSEIAGLGEDGFDLSLLGFNENELAALLVEKTDAETDDDKIPALPTNAISVPGDIWVCGKHRVMCGDSTSVDAFAKLMNGSRADFCFTSPPYNAAITSAPMHSKAPKAGAGGLYVGGYGDDRTSSEYIQFNADIIGTLATVAADDFTCCYNVNYNKNSPSEYIDIIHSAKQSLPLIETIVWEKQMAVSLQGDNLTRIYEFVFVLAKGRFRINKARNDCLRNLWKISNIGANHETHKACFPVALVEEGIKWFCPHGGVIAEPFGGSGTTMIAAEKMGCVARLMELDPKYCDLIVARWQDFTGEKAIHADTGLPFDESNLVEAA
jgi:DNA modification methylase